MTCGLLDDFVNFQRGPSYILDPNWDAAWEISGTENPPGCAIPSIGNRTQSAHTWLCRSCPRTSAAKLSHEP